MRTILIAFALAGASRGLGVAKKAAPLTKPATLSSTNAGIGRAIRRAVAASEKFANDTGIVLDAPDESPRLQQLRESQPAYQPVAMLRPPEKPDRSWKLANLTSSDQPADLTRPVPGGFAGQNLVAAFVIAPEKLFDEKAMVLWQLGFDPRRIPPVHTDLTCIGDLASRTGCFLGHRAAWAAVAALGKKALVLESDWSIGDLTGANAQKLAAQLHRLGERDDDITKVGSCGYFCNTAYFIGPSVATLMQNEDPCNHPNGTDVWVKDICFNETAAWNSTQLQGHTVKCRIVRGGSGYAQAQGLYGSGLIFQDRRHIKGLHDQDNTGRYNESHYDTY